MLLIYSLDTLISTETDLDTDDDGLIELPENAVLLDNFGWGAASYSEISVRTEYAVHAATRYKDNKMVSGSAWMYGELSGFVYSGTASLNKPAGASVTPAGTNFPETAAMLVKPVLETGRTTMNNPDAGILPGRQKNCLHLFPSSHSRQRKSLKKMRGAPVIRRY